VTSPEYRSRKNRFYVKAVTNVAGKVLAYGVYDEADSERGRFELRDYPVKNALHLANMLRDDLNERIA
jgi:hypothetical protein